MNRIKAIGFPDEEMDSLTRIIRNVLVDLEVDYQLVSLEWSNDQVIVIPLDESVPAQGVYKGLDLPPLAEFLSRWAILAATLSRKIPDAMVSMVVSGAVHVFLKGEEL